MRTRTRVRVHKALPTSVLSKWKARSAVRLNNLKDTLLKAPADASKARSRREWLERMTRVLQARTDWLEARLEHAHALHGVLRLAQESLDRAETAPAETTVDYPSGRGKPDKTSS